MVAEGWGEKEICTEGSELPPHTHTAAASIYKSKTYYYRRTSNQIKSVIIKYGYNVRCHGLKEHAL